MGYEMEGILVKKNFCLTS